LSEQLGLRIEHFGRSGPDSNKVTWEWGRLLNEKPEDLYSSSNIIWVIKSRWVGTWHMGGGRER
jgi:hypothetical protein